MPSIPSQMISWFRILLAIIIAIGGLQGLWVLRHALPNQLNGASTALIVFYACNVVAAWLLWKKPHVGLSLTLVLQLFQVLRIQGPTRSYAFDGHGAVVFRGQHQELNVMKIRIRTETSADLQAIEALTAAAFRDALHTSHTEHFIVNALREAGKLTVSLVAQENVEIVGHVAVSPVTISDGSDDWFGLGPVSVSPERQRQGIGSRLMEQALAELRKQGASGCVVLGYPQFYSRFGFRTHPNLVPPDMPPEYFLAVSFGTKSPAGTVSYHEAFNAVN